LAFERDEAAVAREVRNPVIVELPVRERHGRLGLVAGHVELAGGADLEEVLKPFANAVERLEPEAVGHRRLAERRLREYELRDHVCPPPLEPARPEAPLAGRVGIHQRTGTPSAALAQVPLDLRVERRADPAPALLRRDGDPEAALAGRRH